MYLWKWVPRLPWKEGYWGRLVLPQKEGCTHVSSSEMVLSWQKCEGIVKILLVITTNWERWNTQPRRELISFLSQRKEAFWDISYVWKTKLRGSALLPQWEDSRKKCPGFHIWLLWPWDWSQGKEEHSVEPSDSFDCGCLSIASFRIAQWDTWNPQKILNPVGWVCLITYLLFKKGPEKGSHFICLSLSEVCFACFAHSFISKMFTKWLLCVIDSARYFPLYGCFKIPTRVL